MTHIKLNDSPSEFNDSLSELNDSIPKVIEITSIKKKYVPSYIVPGYAL
jgi:hypothetical protein